ncbi:uncharacterized protein [Atheta coriaria]|uniref:uncharacterized protein n=1 Tax=Dalotia coriaria TaxID=877792 RepID=UPI0031F3C1E3
MDEKNSDVSASQALKETAELSDIRRTAPSERAAQDSELKIEIDQSGKYDNTTIETVYENTVLDKTVSSATASRTTASSAPGNTSSPSQINNVQERSSVRSGRLNKLRDHSSNIFPVGCMGCRENDSLPSPRRLMDASEASKDTIGHIENTPRKASMKPECNITRNPLLGTGFTSREILDPDVDNKMNGPRVPPGGFSQGLW